MKKIIYFLFMIICIGANVTTFGQEIQKNNKAKLPYAQMALTAKLMGPAASEPNWFTWCVSPIIGKDGKVNLFVARWPANEGMGGWMGKNAEIAQYVSNKPEGPFSYVRTILKSNDFKDTTKMWAPHNPRISYVDGKYVLLYIYQTEKGKALMHTGMMVADDLNGPWKFAGDRNGEMIAPSLIPGHWTYNSPIGTDNPTFQKIGKKYAIYFKAGPAQRACKYGVALSDNIEGPYKLSDGPLTDNIDYIEDAVAFKTGNKYYLITTDNYGTNTGVFGDLILWKSDTGLDFKLANAKIAAGTLLDYWGTAEEHKKLLSTPGHFEHHPSGKLERPAVLLINDNPHYLYAAGCLNLSNRSVSENYVFKIDWEDGK